ncbi:MAG: glycosyltransferase family 39 protein, partial [Anaerolineae bacterium]|nr:glycosyltransferase family 39 protein [Anaerolineae bacterium]
TRRDEAVAVMQGAAIIAVLMALASTYVFQTALLFEFQDALRMLLVGAGAIAVAAQLSAYLQIGAVVAQPTVQALTPTTLTRWHKRIFGLGVVTLLLLAEANGRILKIPALAQMSSHVQFALLVVSIALMTIGLGGVRWSWRLPRVEWGTVLALLALTAVALFLRFWQLGDGLRIFVDELNFAAVVRSFWVTPNVPLMEPMSSIAAFPYIYPYFQATTIELFGRNLVGLRAASAIIGALTVPAVYLLGRSAFDRTTALLAALLLATFPPHLHFSRLGLNNVADPLFATLALAFIIRGLTRNRRFDFALGGAMLGLTHYFYEGGRFLFTPLVIAWLVGLVVLWRLRWRNLWPVVVMALLVALPIYYTLYAENGPVAARMVNNGAALSADYWQGLLRSSVNMQTHIDMRLIYPLLLYVRVGDGSMFYKGETALLLPALIPLVFVGSGYVLARLRRPGPLVLVIWVLATNLGNSLMVVADHSPRYVLVFPALMLLAAAGLRSTWALLWPSGRLARLGTILLAVLGLTLAIFQANYYFAEHLPTYNDQMRRGLPHRDPQDALLRSLNFPPHTQLHFVSAIPPDPYYTRGVLGFYRDDLNMDSVAPQEITREWIGSLERGIDHAFYVEPGHPEVLNLLRVYFYVLPPQWSPYQDLRNYYQFPLYYAPYLPQYSEDRLARLYRVRQRRDQLPTR